MQVDSLAVGLRARHPKHNLLRRLSLLSEDRLCLATKSTLLAIITSLSLSVQRSLARLILSHFVNGVLVASLHGSSRKKNTASQHNLPVSIFLGYPIRRSSLGFHGQEAERRIERTLQKVLFVLGIFTCDPEQTHTIRSASSSEQQTRSTVDRKGPPKPSCRDREAFPPSVPQLSLQGALPRSSSRSEASRTPLRLGFLRSRDAPSRRTSPSERTAFSSFFCASVLSSPRAPPTHPFPPRGEATPIWDVLGGEGKDPSDGMEVRSGSSSGSYPMGTRERTEIHPFLDPSDGMRMSTPNPKGFKMVSIRIAKPTT